jgi:hypothetical protein
MALPYGPSGSGEPPDTCNGSYCQVGRRTSAAVSQKTPPLPAIPRQLLTERLPSQIMTDPDETANLIDGILQAYREHAAAEGAEMAVGDEEGQAEELGEDPDCA